MHPALDNLCGPGKPLKAEAPDAHEFAGLLRTLGLGPEVWRVLDKCHNARNLGEYEGLLDVDERLVTDLIAATQAVADALDRK
jgi:hypothetical protein